MVASFFTNILVFMNQQSMKNITTNYSPMS